MHAFPHFARLFVAMGTQSRLLDLLFPRELIILLQQCRQLIRSALRIERTELHRFFRLYGKRLQFCRMCIHDIIQAYKIALILAQFAQCLLLARAVLRNACSFLEEHAAIFGAAVENIIQAVLPDDAHAVMPDARICKELIDVLDTAA